MKQRVSIWRWENVAERANIFALHRLAYRLLGGRLVGTNVLILTTIGRKSGKARSTPLFYVRDAGGYVVIASNGGDDRYPGWWHNIRASSQVEVQVGNQVMPCRAVEVGAADYERCWALLTAVYGGYERYRERTRRRLTLFRLTPYGPGLDERPYEPAVRDVRL